jgi:hypothetical protein
MQVFRLLVMYLAAVVGTRLLRAGQNSTTLPPAGGSSRVFAA